MGGSDPRPTGHVVARIGKPHGIRGEVTVQLRTDDPAGRFVAGTVFATRAAAGSGVPHLLRLAGARCHNGVWLLRFTDIPDRTGAEGLRGTLLLTATETPDRADRADRDSAAPRPATTAETDDPQDDAWYPEDLVGLPVFDLDGAHLGRLAAVEHGPAQDLLVVALGDERMAYIPFVTALVPVVDVAGGRIVVDPPPGLLELAE